MQEHNDKHNPFERFSKGTSLLHAMDPRVKIAGIGMFAAAIAAADRLPVIIGALILALVSTAAARLDAKGLFQRMLVVNTFVLLLWIFLPLTHPGTAIYSGRWITVTREGLDLALVITIKCNAIVLATIALLSTSTVASLVHALHHLSIPDKIVHLLFFSYRYMHVAQKDYRRFRNAMKIRGFKPRTNMHTYRTYAYLVGNMFVRSHDRANRIYNAMLCRGFKGKFYLLYHFSVKRSDAVAFVVIVLCVGTLIFFQWLP